MSFLKLYQFAEAKAHAALEAGDPSVAPVAVRDIQAEIIEIGMVAEIHVDVVDLDQKISKGHIIIEDQREGLHDDPHLVAKIRVDRDLNRCWIRYVTCKELMHVFDNEEEVVSDAERFHELMEEVDSPRMGGDMSPRYISEFGAMWMALLILCPRNARNEWKGRLERGEVTPYQVALRFRIPEDVVHGLMDDYYERAYDRLIGTPLRLIAAAAAAERDPNDPIAA